MQQIMSSNRVFLGCGISIIAWAGNRGQICRAYSREVVSRKEYHSSSIVVCGSFRMTEGPKGEDMSKWPLLRTGDMPRDVCPGFQPGWYTYSAMEDNSMEYCAGTVNQIGQADNCVIETTAVKPGKLHVPYRHVLILVSGELKVRGQMFKTPYIAHAKSLDGFDCEVTGKGMLVFRPSV